MRKTTAIFLFCLILLVACASPAPQPTTTPTVRPTLTATATQTPIPTETTIPTPTETATPEVVAAIEIANMGEFDPAWYTDVGKVVEVKDLYGAGAALITILDVKNLPEGQVIRVLKFRSNGKSNLDPYTIWNVGVVSVQLIDVDLKTNVMPDGQPIGDGKWCRIVGQIDVAGRGQLTTFTVINKGNIFNGNDTEKCFNEFNPGDVISMALYFSEESLTFEESQPMLNTSGKSDEVIAKARFSKIGGDYTAMTWNDILNAIKNGENLGGDEVSVLKIN